jgi:hypothetical protein
VAVVFFSAGFDGAADFVGVVAVEVFFTEALATGLDEDAGAGCFFGAEVVFFFVVVEVFAEVVLVAVLGGFALAAVFTGLVLSGVTAGLGSFDLPNRALSALFVLEGALSFAIGVSPVQGHS